MVSPMRGTMRPRQATPDITCRGIQEGHLRIQFLATVLRVARMMQSADHHRPDHQSLWAQSLLQSLKHLCHQACSLMKLNKLRSVRKSMRRVGHSIYDLLLKTSLQLMAQWCLEKPSRA